MEDSAELRTASCHPPLAVCPGLRLTLAIYHRPSCALSLTPTQRVRQEGGRPWVVRGTRPSLGIGR
jgi:hypothetical protein